ncbi:MAG: hypothetical protein LC655_02830, partial [Bacteroidales bacterium]|nr:hypothetical protein [Bacteroidales bacterium]
MDFDIGTLFYILITIIAIVASVLGKKKKPAEGQQSSDEESGPFGFFSKLEEQIEGLVDDTKKEVHQVSEEIIPAEVITAEQRDDNRILQDKDSYDWQSASFHEDTATSGDYYNEFEGYYDPKKQEGLDAIIEEAENSTSDEAIQVIDVEDISHPDYFK